MKKTLSPIFCWVIFASGLAFANADAAPLEPQLDEAEKINFALRKAKHWKGSDGAMTVNIGHGKTLWLFGDTWIKGYGDSAEASAGPAGISRSGPGPRTMINNSIAIEEIPVWQKCSHIFVGMRDTFDRLKIGDSTWTFWYRGTPDKPESMFKPKEVGAYYWPGCGATNSSDKLFLIMKKVRPKENADPLFAFDWFGEDLVVVKNRDIPPSGWTYTSTTISSEQHEVQFGLGCTGDSDYFYSLCYLQRESNPEKKTILARILWSDLEAAKNWEYLYAADSSSSSQWRRGAMGAKNVFPDGAPEMSIFFHRGLQCYVTVYQPPLSRKVAARFARKIEGPWSASMNLYESPQIKRKDGKEALIYAGKAHEHMSAEHEIGFTYCANPGGAEDHERNPEIYFPTALSVPVAMADVQALLDAAEESE